MFAFQSKYLDIKFGPMLMCIWLWSQELETHTIGGPIIVGGPPSVEMTNKASFLISEVEISNV